jgi:hypothetical protein
MTLMADEFQIAYCREARRLRCAHAGRPGRMLRAIGELSARYDAIRRPESARKAEPVTVARVVESARTEFTRRADAELSGDVLNYSRRLELLDQADRLGIGRFEANLLIAEAQHRAGTVIESLPPSRHIPLGLMVGAALGLELLLAVVIYHVLV